MSDDCKLSPTSFSCCVCLEDNKCNEKDDPQTYLAYLKWMKKYRTNYVQTPVAVEICANHHMCSQELYDSVRKQAIEKRGLDTYPIACPVLGCAEKLIHNPKEHKIWNFLIEMCPNGHLIDNDCYMHLRSIRTEVCPLCRSEFRGNDLHCIPTLPITSLHKSSERRNLDGMGVFLDLTLCEETARGGGIFMDNGNDDESMSWLIAREPMSYEDFPSMIQEIFIDPRHDSPVPGVSTKVPLVFILAQNNVNYQMLQKLVASFLEDWDSVKGVIDVLTPCGPLAFDSIRTKLMRMLLSIRRVFPPNTKRHENVVEKLKLVLIILDSADNFVVEEWCSIQMDSYNIHRHTSVINEVVPEIPALPDVANPSGPIT